MRTPTWASSEMAPYLQSGKWNQGSRAGGRGYQCVYEFGHLAGQEPKALAMAIWYAPRQWPSRSGFLHQPVRNALADEVRMDALGKLRGPSSTTASQRWGGGSVYNLPTAHRQRARVIGYSKSQC